ncbi:MAG: anti-sigma F factor [Clostridiales bacterium]|nr:anti-sigma F factor [Clostridiales bacterium]
MSYKNEMMLQFTSLIENEGFARLAVASFCAHLALNIEDINDIKTAVSEAVTNAIVHGYCETEGLISISVKISNEQITIIVSDNGVGIPDIHKAIQPFYTTKADMERSGMGFTVMEGFMDEMNVSSKVGDGTTVTLIKYIKK